MIKSTSQGPKSQVTSSKMGERIRKLRKYVGLNERRGLWRGGGGQERGRRGRERKEEESQVTKQRNKEREWTANRARPLDEFAKSRKKEGKGEGRGKREKKKEKGKGNKGTEGRDERCEM